MNKPAKVIPLMLLMCFSSQIKCTDTAELSKNEAEVSKDKSEVSKDEVEVSKDEAEVSNRREYTLKHMIKACLINDYQDDHFYNIRNALSNDFICRRLISFLAITPTECFTDADFLFDDLQEKNFFVNPVEWVKNFIEIKKSIIENAYLLFQDWQKASRLSKDFVENRDILTDNFEVVLARLTVYLHLLRLSSDPNNLYIEALLEVSINSGNDTQDTDDTINCKKAFREIYEELKPYI